MAKFTKTINLWADGVQESILNGSIVLQRGQYVECCQPSERGVYPLSRYVSHSANGTFNVVHGGTGKQVLQRFNSRVEHARLCDLFHQNKPDRKPRMKYHVSTLLGGL
jgi:hypothetical protein